VGWSCGRLRRSSLVSLDTLSGASRLPAPLARLEPTLGAASQLAWVRTHLQLGD